MADLYSSCRSIYVNPCSPHSSNSAPSASAQVQEVLASLPAYMQCMSTPSTAVQLRAALARLEGEQALDLPQADYAAHRSLEALRLEDPASMSGCWNPGCAAAHTLAGIGGPSRSA